MLSFVVYSNECVGKKNFPVCNFEKENYICAQTFRGSSMVEHATVNRRVAGSSPARGAEKGSTLLKSVLPFSFFIFFAISYCALPRVCEARGVQEAIF